MLAVTPSFLRAAFLKAGTVTAELGDDARCMLPCNSCPVSADEVMGSSSHEKRGADDCIPAGLSQCCRVGEDCALCLSVVVVEGKVPCRI